MTQRGNNSDARKARGHAADAKGLRFEIEVTNHFAREGWQLEGRYKFRGFEFDILGKKEFMFSEEYLLVECKDKETVTAAEVLRFMRKTAVFWEEVSDWFGPELTSIIAHTGKVSEDAVEAARSHNPPIDFLHFSM